MHETAIKSDFVYYLCTKFLLTVTPFVMEVTDVNYTGVTDIADVTDET